MDRNGYSKIATQGKITATIYPHIDEFRQRKYDASTPHRNRDLYPGGESENCHWILDGELVFGNRKEDYKQSELGFSSISGLPTTNLNKLAKDMYFVGVSIATSKFGGDNVYGDTENVHALAVDKAGTRTITVTGPYQISAGDLVAWELPDPKSKHFRLLNQPKNKWIPLVVPFDQTTLKLDTSDLLDSMDPSAVSSPDDKISDMGFENLLDFHKKKFDENRFTPNQIEAAGFKYGLAMMFLKGIQHLNDLNEDITFENLEAKMGLFEKTDESQKFTHDLIKAMVDSTPAKNETGFEKYKHKAMQLFDDSRNEAFKSKTSRIIGKAMNTATTGEDLDIMIGHTPIY